MREAFDHVDRNRNGRLDKAEIADVLGELGKSDHQIQKLLSTLPNGEMDFESFLTFMTAEPEARPFLNWTGYIPYPNVAKVHDTPLIGSLTSAAQDAVLDTYGATVGSAWGAISKIKEE